MEFQLPIQLSFEAAATLVALLFFFYFLQRWKNNTNVERKPPQPSGSWPVIGHLHLLGKLSYSSLGKLADKYGPIFMVKLGAHQTLVVSSPEMARECLGINDKVFASRPQTIYVEHLAYNSAMFGFGPYGSYWREIRKITTLGLLSNHRVQKLKHVRISEVRSAIKELFDNHQAKVKSGAGSAVEPVDLKNWFGDLSLNSTVRMVAGKSLKEFYQPEEYDRFKTALRDFFELAGTFVPADVLPFLRWLDIGGYEKTMKKVAKEIDHMAEGWLEEHKRREATEQDNENQDFMDVMLGVLKSGLDTPTIFDTDTIVKSNCIEMILGGVDTTSVTLTWALSLLLNNRDALKKVQEEMDALVGKERQVDESDLKNFEYLQAILKETLRLYPAAPLLVPREAITDCTVKGYNISAGTQLFVNAYKIHRDPQAWPDPSKFYPERFLTTHKEHDVRGQCFDFLPFGSGRRICPGISFALMSIQFALANLLHGFEIATPSGEEVDMTESLGMTNLKATPLKVILIPRLPDNMYVNHPH